MAKARIQASGPNAEFTLELEDLDPRTLLVLLDKPFTERVVETGDRGETRTRYGAFDQYAAALGDTAQAERTTTGGGAGEPPPTPDEGVMTALDLDDFDIKNPADLIEVVRSLLEDAKAEIKTSRDQSGKRTLTVHVELAGRTFDFDLEDLERLAGDLGAVATGLSDENTGPDEPGGEEIVAHPATRSPRRLIRRFRATANGDDTLRNDNTNTLVQTKGGFVVASAADVNLNAGLNGTLAIFIA
ncbi:MAG: hypothetical protein KatS3mg043_2036 [Rhodothermaceae bacterium]|nr:MAG: hypothetical protein KatS3mg043_2036 [Rhodothermaceae bacterium]